jgi:[acyl-carrier-protein] S-malonyltransferase
VTEPEKVAYIFPGQGSQSVGMGRDLYDNFNSAKAIFEQADKVLEFPLSKLCFEGPEDELQLTINTQPALVTVSFACFKAIQETANGHLPVPAFVAGHSLGEYTALAASNVIDFSTAVYLARERGRLMYEAGLKQPGGMIAIIGLDEGLIAGICGETDTRIANYNCPGQLVISGEMANLPKAVELAQAKGASRIVPLQVSGAFHTPLMQSAKDGLSEILNTLDFHSPSVPIIANTTAQPMTAAEEIKTELTEQLCNGIQWQRSVEYMINDGVSTFIEIGPGRVLSGLIKRINRDVNTRNIGDVEAIKNFVSQKPE